MSVRLEKSPPYFWLAPHRWTPLLSVMALWLLGIGCGGGTSGTSPIPRESFRLVGVTEDAQRAPLREASMSVISGSNDDLLLDSETDARGSFAMELPGDEPSLVFEVGGTRSTPLKRQLLGPSIVSTKLTQNSSGGLSFEDTFEAQVDPSSLCSSLETQANEIIQNAEPIPSTCPVILRIRSEKIPTATIQATLSADCLASPISASPNTSGAIVIDLAAVLGNGCSNTEIAVSATNTELPEATFPVLEFRE